jgi:anti-anti-sigma factor
MDTINVSSIIEDDIIIFSISGEINADNTVAFRKFMEQNLTDFHVKVLFDLDGLEYINSMGIGTIVKSIKSIQKHDGDACLSGLNENIKHILKLTGLNAILNIFEDKDEALFYLKT